MNIELEIKDIKHDLNYAKKCEYDHVTLDVYKVQALLTAYEKEKEKNRKYLVNLTHEQYIKLVEQIRSEISKKWKDKIKAMLENEIINISGFECVAKGDVQSLLGKE